MDGAGFVGVAGVGGVGVEGGVSTGGGGEATVVEPPAEGGVFSVCGLASRVLSEHDASKKSAPNNTQPISVLIRSSLFGIVSPQAMPNKCRRALRQTSSVRG